MNKFSTNKIYTNTNTICVFLISYFFIKKKNSLSKYIAIRCIFLPH